MSDNHNIVPITFPGSGDKIRVVEINDEPWFVAADLCREIGLAQVAQAVRQNVVGGSSTKTVLQTDGGPQDMIVVNEAGMYEIVISSRKPGAKIFRTWIFNEVIPAIRKTGFYETAEHREAKVLELLEAGDEGYRRIEWAKQNGEIPSWVAQQFADSQGLLTDALGFPAVLTTSGRIDDENGVGINRSVRFVNGQQRSRMFKAKTGRLPFKAPTFRRGQYRIVNHFPKGQAAGIEGFHAKQPKALDK
jgi:prophage antirepressor-like protein